MADMISEEPTDYIAREYIQLWKEYGVDIHLTDSKIIHHGVKPAPKEPRTLPEIRAWLGNCQRCELCKGRKNIVFGDGNEGARLMFIGEGPGADEDAQALPFVGRAGQLLTKIIEAMGYRRADVYIANVVKCRPPLNRTPAPEEIAACTPFLAAQVNVVRPEVIVALGATAAFFLLGHEAPISKLRGRFHPLQWNFEIPVMPTYHPAYLLRNPAAKKLVWEDVRQVKDRLERRS